MSSNGIKKIAVLTSGGDSPAMNAVVYGLLAAAKHKNIDVYGVIDGYRGFIDGNFQLLDLREFRKNVYLSGTAIGSSRCLEFKQPEVRKKAVEQFQAKGFDGLLVVGGDGSYWGASLINDIGCKVLSAPGTIDNDVASTQYTIGYFSALEEIFQAIKKIKSTSESHSQVTFLEVMGRHCHDLTVAGALAGAVDYVITNTKIKTADELTTIVQEMIDSGKKGIVILVTEKVYSPGNSFGLPEFKDLCPYIEQRVKRQVRYNVLGYLQRGAAPTSWDLYIAQRYGIHALNLMLNDKFGYAIGFNGKDFYETPLSEAIALEKNSETSLIDFVNSSYKI